MNQRLEKNPQIRLPENYKRIKENVLCIEFKAFTGNKNKNLALEIIDDVIFNCLRFHFLLPIVTIESKYKAKEISFQEDGKLSSIFQFSRIESFHEFSKLSPYTKLAALSVQYSNGDDLIECGKFLDDVLYSVEKASQVIISKHAKPAGSINNKIVKEKNSKKIEKFYETQKNEKKRKTRMKMIQQELDKYNQQKEYKLYLEEQEKKKKSSKKNFMKKD